MRQTIPRRWKHKNRTNAFESKRTPWPVPPSKQTKEWYSFVFGYVRLAQALWWIELSVGSFNNHNHNNDIFSFQWKCIYKFWTFCTFVQMTIAAVFGCVRLNWTRKRLIQSWKPKAETTSFFHCKKKKYCIQVFCATVDFSHWNANSDWNRSSELRNRQQ